MEINVCVNLQYKNIVHVIDDLEPWKKRSREAIRKYPCIQSTILSFLRCANYYRITKLYISIIESLTI